MLIKPTLFLMNEEGASPGGGAAPVPPASAPASGATATQAPAPSLTADDVKGMLSEFRNGLFADLRKTGALKGEKPAESTPAQASAPAATAPSMADLERTIEIKFAVNQMRSDHGLSEAAATHLKAYLSNSKPDDVYSAAKSFLGDLGLVKAPTQPVPATAAVTPPAQAAPSQPAPIATAKLGSPAPGDSLDVETLVASNPLNVSGHDYANYAARVGKDAPEKFRASVNAYLSTVKLVPENRRRR